MKQLQYYMKPERPAVDKQGEPIYDVVGKDHKGNDIKERRMVPNYGSLAL